MEEKRSYESNAAFQTLHPLRQQLAEGQLARLLLRAESCAQILANQEYGRTVRDTQMFMLGMIQCLYLLQREDGEV